MSIPVSTSTGRQRQPLPAPRQPDQYPLHYRPPWGRAAAAALPPSFTQDPDFDFLSFLQPAMIPSLKLLISRIVFCWGRTQDTSSCTEPGTAPPAACLCKNGSKLEDGKGTETKPRSYCPPHDINIQQRKGLSVPR